MRPNNKKYTWVLGHRHLMSESESLINYARDAGNADQKKVALRVTEKMPRYLSWECLHSGLMKPLSASSTSMEQAYGLRATTLSLAHNGMLIRHLQARGLTGREREHVVRCLHPHQDYVSSVVNEHARYIRAEASSMCARYLACKLGDQRLVAWYQTYVTAVDEYFSMYCECAVAESRGEHSVLEPLLLEKKAEIAMLRDRILSRSEIPAHQRYVSGARRAPQDSLTSSGILRILAKPGDAERARSQAPATRAAAARSGY